MYKEQGLVLFVMLVVLSVVTAWVVGMLDKSNMAYQVSWHHWQQLQVIETAEQGLQLAKQALRHHDMHCEVKLGGAEHGCVGQLADYEVQYRLQLLAESKSQQYYQVNSDASIGVVSVKLEAVYQVINGDVSLLSWKRF